MQEQIEKFIEEKIRTNKLNEEYAEQGFEIIYGKPKAAFETGDVDFVLTPEEIQSKLIKLVGHQ